MKSAPSLSLFALLTFLIPIHTSAAVLTTADFTALKTAIAAGGYVRLAFDGTIVFTQRIDVTKDVEIDASDYNVTFDGASWTRFFQVSGAHLKMNAVTLTNGRAQPQSEAQNGSGGAITVADGSLTLTNVTFTGCEAVGTGPFYIVTEYYQFLILPGGRAYGGAIAAGNSTILLSKCAFLKNRALGGDGAQLFNIRGGLQRIAGGSAFGGAIWTTNCPSVTLRNTTFNENSAVSGANFESAFTLAGGGGALHAGGSGMVEAVECLFTSNNVMRGSGGALSLDSTSQISSCVFLSNVSTGQNGSMSALNQPRPGNHGGAIASSAVLSISQSTFTGNVCHGAASIYFPGPFGIYSAIPGHGGAVATFGPSVIANCSFLSNSAVGGSGAAGPQSLFGQGGAIYALSNSLTLIHVSLASNTVAQSINPNPSAVPLGSAIYVSTNATLQMQASVIGRHHIAPAVLGAVNDLNYNLSIDNSPVFSAPASLNNIDPLIQYPDPGATPFLALQSGSPAINRVPLRFVLTDIRGALRPNTANDSGCFERAADFLATSIVSDRGEIIFDVGYASRPLNVFSTTDFEVWVDAGKTASDSALRQTYRPSSNQPAQFYKFETGF